MEEEKKDGIWVKGYTRIPNLIMEVLPFFMDTKSAILLVIIRQTFGWENRPYDEMTTSFFKKATHKSERNIERQLAELQKQNIIKNYKGNEKDKNLWGLNIKYSQWKQPDKIVIQKRKGKTIGKEPDKIVGIEPDKSVGIEPDKIVINNPTNLSYKKENIKKEIILNKELKKDTPPNDNLQKAIERYQRAIENG